MKKKILAQIDAMPIEELSEIVKKTLEESHIPYTIEEGGQILFPGIFTDGSNEGEVTLSVCLNFYSSENDTKYFISNKNFSFAII